jgi:hypothetical protein
VFLLTYESRPFIDSRLGDMICQFYWQIGLNSETLAAKNPVFHIFAAGPEGELTTTYEECINPKTNEKKLFGKRLSHFPQRAVPVNPAG